MAISPKDEYPGQTVDDDPGYPYGKARNVDSPGDGSGTPWEERLVNDIFGFQQALLDEAAIAPSGNPDEVGGSQYLDAVNAIIDTKIDAHALTGYRLHNVLVFRQAGADSWSRPQGVRAIRVRAVGAGGGGGYSGNPQAGNEDTAGGGGGGGGAIDVWWPLEEGDTSASISVGAGGAGGTSSSTPNGSSGGDTTFTIDGRAITATGGGGGAGGDDRFSSGGAGGTHSIHISLVGIVTQVSGARGAPGFAGIQSAGSAPFVVTSLGFGGSSIYAGGGAAGYATTGSVVGGPGLSPGAGGGGATASGASGHTNVGGGDGANGHLIVEEYV